jgi:excisionase family DNA binding protein
MSEPFIPIEKLAEHFTVSTSTIRSWVRRGDIPAHTYIKVGNTYRFSKEDVSAALLNRGVDAPQPVSVSTESVSATVEEPLSEVDLDDLDNDI